MFSSFLTSSRRKRSTVQDDLERSSRNRTASPALSDDEQDLSRSATKRGRGRRRRLSADQNPDADESSFRNGSYRPTKIMGATQNSQDVGIGRSSSPGGTIPNPIAAEATFSASAPAEWHEQEIKRPSSRASSRARTLYPPPKSNFEQTDAGISINISPPEVVRLDSQGLQSGDEGGQDPDSFEPPYEPTFSRSNPHIPYAYVPTSNSNLNRYATTSRESAASRYQGRRTSRGTSPSGWQRQYASSGSQSRNQSPPGPLSSSLHPPSESQSEADFYASAVEDLDTDMEGSVGDHVAIPIPARSTTSTSSSSRSGLSSSASTGAGGDPASGNVHSMSKHKWGLKLQVQQLSRNRHQGDRSGSGFPESSSDLSLNLQHPQEQTSTMPSQTPDFPASSVIGIISDLSDAKHYHYPHGHPLSPIEEQDYISPSPNSSKEEERAKSIKFRGGSTNVLNSLTMGERQDIPSPVKLKLDKRDSEIEGDDRASVRTGRSARTGSVGSFTGLTSAGMSRAGSGGGEAGASSALHNGPKSSGGPTTSPLGTPSIDGPRPSPFLTRQLNRTVSQTSTRSLNAESNAGQLTPMATPTQSSAQPSPRMEGAGPGHVQTRNIMSHLPATPKLGSPIRRVALTSGDPTSSTPHLAGSGTTYSPTSTLQQSASSNTSATAQTVQTIQPPPGAIVATTPAVPTVHGGPTEGGGRPGAPTLPSIPTFDFRFSILGGTSPRNSSSRRVDRMPVIQDGGSSEGFPGGDEYEDVEIEEEDEEYERQSLHAESFVTAGDENHETGGGGRAVLSKERMELDVMDGNKDAEGGEGQRESDFIHRRWERDEALGSGAPISSDHPIVLAKSGSNMSSLTPAFWTFWLGFGFPVLWLVGGWHFTNAGEMPPKYTIWEWYFWNRRWRPRRWLRKVRDGLCGCCGQRRRRQSGTRIQRTRKEGGPVLAMDNRGSLPDARARAGMVYPSLPRWVAEKQSTDDGRMRLNDPKRSLRGIQFGYPFIPRYGSGRHHPPSTMRRIATSPNRVLNQLYGVRLREVHGRPETGRRMFDPWVQRCRYAFCYALLLLAVGLCAASMYLIVVNTRNIR